MNAKTFLIIGASGFLGSNLVQFLKPRHKVIAAFNKRLTHYPGVSHVMYSLNDRDYMKRVFTLMRPDFVIYCAGVNDFLECAKNPAMAESVNTVGPLSIASAGDTVPHKLIYISSTYVYDGVKGNFGEKDAMFPETQFGKSKLAAGNFITSKCSDYTLFRFSPLIGAGSVHYQSLVDRIRMKLQLGYRVDLPENELHSFLSIQKAMEAIEWVALNESKNSVYNLGGLTKVSLYDFGKMLAEKLGLDTDLIVPGKGQFDRDTDFSLNGSELIKQSQIDPLLLEQSLDLFKQNLIA